MGCFWRHWLLLKNLYCHKWNIKKDDLIVIPEGVKRGVKALEELTILHVVHPPPSAQDHNEVHAKLAEGKFE